MYSFLNFLAYVEGHFSLDPAHPASSPSLSYAPVSLHPLNRISLNHHVSLPSHKLSPSGLSTFHNILTDRPSLSSSQYSSDVLPWKAFHTPTGQTATASVPQHRAPPSHVLWGQHLIHLHFGEIFKGRCWVSPDPVSAATSLVPDTWRVFVEWMDRWRRHLLQKELGNGSRQHAFYQSYSLIRLSVFLHHLTLKRIYLR